MSYLDSVWQFFASYSPLARALMLLGLEKPGQRAIVSNIIGR